MSKYVSQHMEWNSQLPLCSAHVIILGIDGENSFWTKNSQKVMPLKTKLKQRSCQQWSIVAQSIELVYRILVDKGMCHRLMLLCLMVDLAVWSDNPMTFVYQIHGLLLMTYWAIMMERRCYFRGDNTMCGHSLAVIWWFKHRLHGILDQSTIKHVSQAGVERQRSNILWQVTPKSISPGTRRWQ